MGDGMHAISETRDVFDYNQLSADFDAIDEDLLVGGGGVTSGGGGCTENDSSSIFYGGATSFPPLPCMSSASSSSSTPAPPTTMACSSTASSSATSSSSAASWAVLKSDGDEDDKPQAVMDQQPSDCFGGGGGDVACMDVMETFGYMDLMEDTEIWDDPSSIFGAHFHQAQDQQQQYNHHHQQQQLLESSFSPAPSSSSQHQPFHDSVTTMLPTDQCRGVVAAAEGGASEDLAAMFFEWLKTNKESISAEDLRSIRLKRSTIECAARRLGGGKEGMKRLLKLILEWVQNHQLHRQEKRADGSPDMDTYRFLHNPNPNPNPDTNISNSSTNTIMVPDQTPCFSPPSAWNNNILPLAPPPPPYGSGPGFPSMGGYMEPLNINGNPNYAPSNDYHLDTAKSWPTFDQIQQYNNPYPADNHISAAAAAAAQPAYGNQYTYQYFPGNGEKLVRLGSSATKEARQKRMARQRRLLSHNRHIHNHHAHHQNQHSQIAPPDHQHANGTAAANWYYWPNAATAAAPVSSSSPPEMQPEAPVQTDRDRVPSQNYPRQERRQGWKSEKNLKFLLQKVLKQSDVGNLGRIVLPKKEAETHLPELDARDGISIPMEDISTSRVWNMRYRFWPNNKSRMYLLENTGEFVRSNGLQEGDFIVIYSDVKCGKYMIRGVKVRQPGQKPELKKSGKGHKNQHHHNKANNTNEMRNCEKNNKATALTDCMNMDVQMCG